MVTDDNAARGRLGSNPATSGSIRHDLMASTRQRRGGAAARSLRGRRPDSARTRTASSPSRRKALRRRLVALLSVATLLGSAYIVLFTPLLGVDSVRVEGTRSVPASRVVAAASIEHGKPLLRLDTAAIRSRVSGLTALSGVEISRSWPSSVVISVTERTPLAVLETGQGYRLVDRAGVVFRTVPDNPKGLPALEVSQAAHHDRARQATAAVVAALPDQLRTRVRTVSAGSEHTVRLTLDDGTTVIWGSAERSGRKARVLAALLTQPGSVYDVSTPALPTIR